MGDQRYGQLEPSREQVQVGFAAARLSYDFPAVPDNYVVFRAPAPIASGMIYLDELAALTEQTPGRN